MPKEWSITNNSHGMSVVEVLLAATIFGMLIVSIGGAIIYGRASTAGGGDRNRAAMLADEGIEAVRNIRDNSYSNLVDGTYGLAQSSNQWMLSGSSDTNGIYNRQTTISSGGTDRKIITSEVSWTTGSVSRQVSATSQLTNWAAAIAKSWTRPTQRGIYDASGTNNGIKVATQGNYAYVVRNDGTPDFMIINISDPANPTLVGSLNLAGIPTNIAVSGNYAYVTNTSDSAELQTIEITTPSAPVLRSSYNASGAADGTDVYASGGYAYVVRKANGGNNEFVALNMAIPTLPVRVGYYNLNINMNEIYVNTSTGTVYIATDSDTQEIIELNSVLLGLITVSTSVNLPGTANATTIAGFGSTLLVGQGTSFHAVDGGTTNSVLGSLTVTGTINDIDINTPRTFAYLGTNNASGEFQVINIATLANPALAGSLAVSGATTTINGVAYNSTLDVVAGTGDAEEAILFGPN